MKPMSDIPVSPTVGRSVHIYRNTGGGSEGPFAATITAVHSDIGVSVFCMEPNRASHFERVQMFAVGDEPVSGNMGDGAVWAVWPPRYESARPAEAADSGSPGN